MIEIDITNVLTDMSHEAAFLHHKRESTIEALLDEAKLMHTAAERMDVLNLRLGPYTKTILAKVAICKSILEINGQRLSDDKIKSITAYLDKIVTIVNKKIAYGIRLDRFLEKKENDIFEILRENLLDDELNDYKIIQKKLVFFRNSIIKICDKMISDLTKQLPA